MRPRASTPARRRAAAVAVLLALAAVLTACTGIPHSGPIVEIEATGDQADTEPIYINPLPPQPDQSAAAVVKGFLDAMQATPIQTNTARAFLTDEAAASWEPDAATITYLDALEPSGRTQVSVQLEQAVVYDRRGAWQGPLAPERSLLTFPVVREDGEFRISEAPDALIVPESWFVARFQQASLYFLDPTSSILVPDPVFVPSGQQFASNLVRRLLEGPAADMAGHLHTVLPPGVREGLSVPVADGVADIRLTAGSAPALLTNRGDVELLLAQLAWTLRQDPAVERFRVTVGNQLVQFEGDTEFLVADEEFAPYVADASSQLYALGDGRLVSGNIEAFERVRGPFGQRDLGLRSAAVSMDAGQAAGVSADGTRLLLGAVHDDAAQVRTVLTRAQDLLRPAWDHADRVWWVDRRATGAVVGYVVDDVARVVDVPGISGTDVTHLLVSRDGTRLVAVVAGATGDRIMASRIHLDRDGSVRDVGAAVHASSGEPGLSVLDLTWRSPIHVLAAVPYTDEVAELLTFTVDGSPAETTGLPAVVRGSSVELIGSPNPEERTYVVEDLTITDLTGSRRGVPLAPELTDIGYVG